MYSRRITSALLEEACSCIGAQKPDNLMNGSSTININKPDISASKYEESETIEEAVHANHPALKKGGKYFGWMQPNSLNRGALATKIKTLRKERDFLRTPGEGDTPIQKHIQNGLANHYDNHSRLISRLGDPAMMQSTPKSLDRLPTHPRVVKASKK